MIKKILFFLLALVSLTVSAQSKKQSDKMVSPNKHLSVTIQKEGLTICHDGRVALQIRR